MRLLAKVGPPGPGDKLDWWDGLYENEAKDDGIFFRLSGWAPACLGGNFECHGIEPHFEVYHRCNFTANRRAVGQNGAIVDLVRVPNLKAVLVDMGGGGSVLCGRGGGLKILGSLRG